MKIGFEVRVARLEKTLPLLALFCANLISLTGSTLTSLAIPWFVLQTTHSVVKTGISAFFTTLPTIIATLLGGVLVDRVGHKYISVLGDLAAGAGIVLIPLFYHTTGLPFVGLLVLIFLATLLNGPGGTARLSMVPDLAGLAGMPLERANAIAQGINRIAMLIGAPLAGILIALIGTSNLLWIDSASFIVSACIIGIIVPVIRHDAPASANTGLQAAEKKSFLTDFYAGLNFISHDRVVEVILFTFVITNLLDVALTTVITPVYVQRYFQSAVVLGLISAAFVGAALVGTVLYGSVGTRLNRQFTLAISLAIVGLRFWALAIVPPLALILVITAISGLASASINPIVFTIAYERIPVNMRGRVLGVGMAIAALGIPLGVLFSGYLVNAFGMQRVLLVMGTCYLIATLSLLMNPSFYKLAGPKTSS